MSTLSVTAAVTHPGVEIHDACADAIALANRLELAVTFGFNGVTLIAFPGADFIELADSYRWALTTGAKLAAAYSVEAEA